TNCKFLWSSRLPFLFGVMLVASFLAFITASNAASPLVNSFELQGSPNATPPNPPDDWSLLYNGGLNNGGSPDVFTGILFDDANTSTDDNFTSGSKIDDPISAWKWTTGTVGDKQDLNHVAAALYNHTFDPVSGAITGNATNFYFMADLIAGNG